MLGILAKEDAVAFAARLAQVFSPEIRFVDFGAKDQAAEPGTQIRFPEQSPGPGSLAFAGLPGNQNSGFSVR